MTKGNGALLVLALTILGLSAAQAENRAMRGHSVSTGFRVAPPQRPDMRPRDGDYSWCEENETLECGVSQCFEDQGYLLSFCVSAGGIHDSGDPNPDPEE